MTLKIENLSESKLKEFVSYLENLPLQTYSKGVVLDEKDILSFRYYPGNQYVIAIDELKNKKRNEKSIVGHICIMQPKVKYGYHQEHIVEIHINVLQEHQGKGIGKKLLAFFLKEIKKTNKDRKTTISKIKTKMMANNEKVIKLFENFEFKKEALLKKEWKIISEDQKDKKKEAYEDTVLMGLLLK